MKFTIETIQSLPSDGASCHLLIFNKTIKILLDCGISHTFDFKKYIDRIQDIKNVCLILISHSQIQYSGALPFLVDQFGINPKIIYTTQSIMRYSPLNLHEQLLNLCCKAYGKKNFNKIYKIYQSINIIKPQQKKCLDLSSQPQSNQANPSVMEQQLAKPTIGQVSNQLYFTCFSSGSNMGSLGWRLSFGIVNILYLVQFNNYGLYHINGINLQQIMAPTDVLITDTYKNIDQNLIKKNQLYNRIKDILIRFYQRNGMSFQKPPITINPQNQRKLVFSCYPNEMIIQLMAVVKKVIQDFQSPQSRQKIRVVHLSSRFLQLIKSQMDYFSPYFKDSLQNIQQYFLHAKQISGRINITTFQSIQGLLSNSLNTKSIQVYHFGPQTTNQKIQSIQVKGQQNIMKFKLLNIQQKIMVSASKIDIEQQRQQIEYQKIDGSQISSEKQQTVSEAPDEVEIIRDTQQQVHRPLHSKYFNQVGFPRFTSKFRQKQFFYDDYGCRHQYARFQDRVIIYDDKKQIQKLSIQPELHKKNSSIEIMNIQFKIPLFTSLDFSKITFLPFYSHKTTFNSSIQIITSLKPDNIILINTQYSPRQAIQSLSYKYKSSLRSLQSNSQNKQIAVYDINPKNYVHLQIQNQLISYKVNYIPIPQQRKLQKVKGLITYSANGLLYIHLDCLQEKEHLQFRLDKFYKKIKQEEIHQCFFTKQGLIIDGVKIYREQNKIVLEGVYSEEYFKVRRLLYDFLKMQ